MTSWGVVEAEDTQHRNGRRRKNSKAVETEKRNSKVVR